MTTEPKVIKLDTVYAGAMKPGKSYKATAFHAGPFTGRDLLDATYGVADRIEKDLKPCVCGAVTFVCDPREVRYCRRCEPAQPYDGLPVVLEDFSESDGRTIVSLPRKGSRARRFELYGGVWFSLNAELIRGQQVKKESLLADLNRRAGTTRKPTPELLCKPKPYTRFVKTASGYVRQYPSTTEPECNCANEEMHGFYDHAAFAGVCARHGLECGTCGVTH